jgi:hypothetical protein
VFPKHVEFSLGLFCVAGAMTRLTHVSLFWSYVHLNVENGRKAKHAWQAFWTFLIK